MANVDTVDITKLILVEQGSTPSTPAATKQKLFIRSSDHLICTVDSSGVVTPWGGTVATDAIWDAAGDLAVGTGADTAAKLALGNVGSVLGRVNGAVAWNGGTSFPASKATGDRFWRSDLGLECYWDGTRWVTCQQYTTPFMVQGALVPLTAANSFYAPMVNGAYDMWLEKIVAATQVAATNDGSNYWTLQFNRYLSGTSLGSFTTAADSAGTSTAHTITVNAVTGTTDVFMGFSMQKTGTPGGIYAMVQGFYRLIVT